jgi:hypothetical protein
MTLSGNLGFVPLDEVLRLLTRAGNDGMVQITNNVATGRIFVAGKGISLATTQADFGLKEHLASSGYISSADLDAVEHGSKSLGDYFTEGSEGLALLREMTVESIYQLDAADADFKVVKDQTSPFASPSIFDLESVISDSRDRRDHWEKVRKTINDLEAPLRINRELDRESVELRKDSWRLLAEIGSGASVSDLARSLGTTEFAVAKVAADMVQSGLVSIEESAQAQTSYPEPAADPYQESAYQAYSEPEYHAAPAVVEESVTDEVDAELTPSEASLDASDVAEGVNDKSWWDEPVAEVAADEEVESPVFDEEEVDETPVSVDESSAVVAADEDTEAFLEKVFSDIGEETASVDDGHGLMRRRRMGSILRELGED